MNASRYPTTADMAAFRASFPRTGPVVHVATFWQPHSRHAEARREAAAMRSRDYADLVRTATRNIEAPGHPDPRYAHPSLAAEAGIGQRYHVAAWWTERQHGCPTWLPEDPEPCTHLQVAS